MAKELTDDGGVFKTATIAFEEWLIPHWKAHGINVLELVPEKNDDILMLLDFNSSGEAREFQDQLIHDISNLANLNFKRKEYNDPLWDPAIEAEKEEIEVLVKYMVSTPSANWNKQGWIDAIGDDR